MRPIAALLIVLALTGCKTVPHAERIDPKKSEISAEASLRIDEAAGAVQATGVLLSENPPNVEAAKKTNAAAAQALPKPSAKTSSEWMQIADELREGKTSRLDSALDRIAASEARQKNLEAELENLRLQLNATLERQAAADRERAKTSEDRKSIVQKQTLGLTAVGVLLIIAGAFALYRLHTGLAATLGSLGLGLIALGRVVATLPDWVWTALFLTGVIGIPLSLWIGYRRGLFQKPPATVGEYTINQNPNQP